MARYKSGQPANRSKTVKKRTYASRTPQARSYKRPSRMVEQGAGMGNVLRGVARVVGAGGKARAAAGRPKPNPGSRTAKNAAKKNTPATKRTPGRRTAQTPKWATTYGKKKPSQITLKMSARDKAQTKRLQKLLKDKKAKANNKTKAAAGTAAVVGVTGGGVGAAVGYSRRPKRKNGVKDQYGKTSTTRFRK